MAVDIQRKALRSIQTQKRNVPIEQIIAVQGRSPVASGLNALGPVLGQAIARKAELQRQGQELARLESLSGQQPGAFTGLEPSTASSFANKMIENRATSYNPQQLAAIASGDLDALSTSFPGGVPKEVATLSSTTSSREENRAIRKQQMEALKFERDLKHTENRSKEKTDIVNKFNMDPGVRKIQSSIDAASNVRELVMSGNPIAASAIPTYMARASGEVGNLSEADKRPFGGTQAILGRLKASLEQMATGRLTQENAQFLIKLSDVMESSAIANLDRRAKDISGQYGEASDFLKADEIYKTLRPIKTPQPQPIQTSEPITATNKKTGQKIISVDGGKTWLQQK